MANNAISNPQSVPIFPLQLGLARRATGGKNATGRHSSQNEFNFYFFCLSSFFFFDCLQTFSYFTSNEERQHLKLVCTMATCPSSSKQLKFKTYSVKHSTRQSQYQTTETWWRAPRIHTLFSPFSQRLQHFKKVCNGRFNGKEFMEMLKKRT